jgi:hypothetical protein
VRGVVGLLIGGGTGMINGSRVRMKTELVTGKLG